MWGTQKQKCGTCSSSIKQTPCHVARVLQVQLPTKSKLVMDRAHIVRHLLSDQRDPTSREPLTPDMLIPLPELKARISAWVAQTVAEKRAERMAQ